MTRRSLLGFVVAGVAVATLLSGCGGGGSSGSTHRKATSGTAGPNPNAPEVNPAGDIPDTQVYVAYSPPGGGFTVKVPEGWSRSQVGAATVFVSTFNSVRIETASGAAQPTVALVKATEVPGLEAASRGFRLGKVEMVRRPVGSALLVAYRADSTPDPVTGKSVRLDVQRYEFWRAATQVTITLSSPVGADNVDPWRTITDSFGWQG